MSEATVVSICSNACLLLGAKTINDLEDDSDRAQLASNLFPLLRDAFLRSRPWNAATRRVILAADEETPAFDWAYQFSIPPDWLKTLQVGRLGQEVDYVHEGRKILCDDTALPLRYIFRNENVGSWDSLMIHCMTIGMSAAMAYAITSSATKEDLQWKLFAAALREGSAIDGQDDPAQTLGDFRLVSSRFGRAPFVP